MVLLRAPSATATESAPGLPPATVAPEELVEVPTELRELVVAWPPAVATALRGRDWPAAIDGLTKVKPETMKGPIQGTRAFLLAWAMVHAGRAAQAAPYLDLAAGGAGVPPAFLALVRGEVLSATGDRINALAAYDLVPEGSAPWSRAQLGKAAALKELGRTKEAFEVYERLAARPDPSPGSAEALLVLARRHGAGSEQAYPLLRRLWANYPRTDASRAGNPMLEAYGRKPTWQERARRAYALHQNGDYTTVVTEFADLSPPAGDTSDDACRLLFAKGRSHWKKKAWSNAVSAFADIGVRCVGASEDWGARGLYIAGQSQWKRGLYTESAKTNAKIPELYPQSSFADDGWLHSGLGWMEAGDAVEAREAWQRGLDELPDGDMTPEAAWRLAWSHYVEGHPAEAVAVADRLAELPLASDHRHVESGRYWAARWRLYPDVKNPTVPSSSPTAQAEAVALWRAVCEEVPHSYYAILAYSRLVEEAPDVAEELATRPPDHDPGDLATPWRVRRAFFEDPMARAGMDLARIGLIQEAKAAWDHAAVPARLPDEVAWTYELRNEAGDWLLAHDEMRAWLADHPPGTLGERQAQVLRIGYPDHYWAEVQVASQPYRYEPRFFHGLVREESNFNKNIRSPVGAVGLSQVMPTTAAEVAGWLQRPVGDLDDPANNLALGSKYLDVVVGQLAGSPFLALAGYNAGPGRVKEWIGRWGNVPTDEYVERIPFKETRGYVRRVSTTWQTYRYQFDDGDAFPDLSKYNHQAWPK
jgi:soluble lytic murein transglycosylase